MSKDPMRRTVLAGLQERWRRWTRGIELRTDLMEAVSFVAVVKLLCSINSVKVILKTQE